MKRILTVLLLLLVGFIVPHVSYAADDFDTAQHFADIASRGHCETDVDGVATCDYVIVQTSFEAISDSNTYLNFTIPYLGYSDIMGAYEPSERSKLTFYDDDMAVLITVPIYEDDIPTWTREDYFILYLEADVFGVGSVPADLAFFSLTLIYQFGEPQAQSRIPEGFTSYLEEHILYELDDEIGATQSDIMNTSAATAYFYFDFQLYAIVPMDETGVLDLTYAPIIEPPTPRLEGYIFNGWYTSDGARYTWGDYVEVEDFAANRVHFYAGMVPVAPIGETDADLLEGSIITDVLTMIGFNNDAGRVILFTILGLLLMVGMIAIRLPMFVGAIVMLLLSVIFIMMGWLPVYATVLIGLASVLLIFLSFSRREAL